MRAEAGDRERRLAMIRANGDEPHAPNFARCDIDSLPDVDNRKHCATCHRHEAYVAHDADLRDAG